MQAAALYLRSSKDRHDVSLDAQRRELVDLATKHGLLVAETFGDAVERADDEFRPGFQALLHALKAHGRKWNHILVLDTARIARNDQHLAAAFNYECEKRGVKVLYAKLPETGSIMDVVFRDVARAFDRLHSLMSKEKGLGGMAENVRQGWRAGGRAPLGYRLEYTPTGAMRDGEAVTKSRLVLSADATRVKGYLVARISGRSRALAKTENGLADVVYSSLVGLEWNALTYAGHTVWNVHAERINGGGYKGGAKRRPRSEWVIQHNTHEAMISTEDAEIILGRLDIGRPRRYATRAEYLLSGLLVTPEGKGWHGDGEGFYRAGKGRRMHQANLETALVDRLNIDLLDDEFVRDLVADARRVSRPTNGDHIKPLRNEVEAITKRIAKLASLAADTETPRPFLDQIAPLERQREKLVAELERLEVEMRSAEVMRAIRDKDVRTLLSAVASSIDRLDREALKELMRSVLDKIELCPTTLACRLHYRIAAGDLVASPRRSPQIPALRTVRILRIA